MLSPIVIIPLNYIVRGKGHRNKRCWAFVRNATGPTHPQSVSLKSREPLTHKHVTPSLSDAGAAEHTVVGAVLQQVERRTRFWMPGIKGPRPCCLNLLNRGVAVRME